MTLRIPILMYHSISDEKSSWGKWFNVRIREFRDQMAYLHSSGFKAITFDALRDGTIRECENPVILTFDDGYASFFINAFPVLSRYGFPATVFIVTRNISGYNDWETKRGVPRQALMSSSQIHSLHQGGIRIEPHSATHARLDELGDSDAEMEISESKTAIEEMTGRRPISFGFPFGRYSAKTIRFLERHGFQFAVTVENRCAVIGKDDPLRLPRIIVKETYDLRKFAKILAVRPSLFGSYRFSSPVS